ncbi:MAG TPA: DUF2894 domain-containing protein [Rhodoferax sp.]|jgi:hypothetical protein|nr:DUF2894 domain-containing protein [Rhodoferax sp.]HNV58506.1 DUF2894 domain-containing protein [Rhodoferax sp.]HPW28777.1 DUF2894 domain-containing protein [Rhodoferax sp.]
MGEHLPGEGARRVPEQADAFSEAIANLRSLGADRFDPVGLHYLDALERRTRVQNPNVKRILEVKLGHALQDFGQRFQQALSEAKQTMEPAALAHPQAAADLQRLLETGDLKTLAQSIESLKRLQQHDSLGELTLQLEQQSRKHTDPTQQAGMAPRVELKSVRQFRNTWSKLSAVRQVTRAMDKGPKNAGPINSHMLVLRSLALMRDISPDYLNRFVSYVDTLLCLDQSERLSQPAVRAPSEGVTKKKTASRRSVAR